MIVAEIARLTQTKRVGVSLRVPAISGLDIAAEPTVARTAKVLGVVLPVYVLALCNLHGPFSFCGAWRFSGGKVERRRYVEVHRLGGGKLDGRGYVEVHGFGGGQLVVKDKLTRLPTVKVREVLFELKVT